MCRHQWTARQPSSLGASYLCVSCGAQMDRVFDHRYSEDEADQLNLVDEIVREVYTSGSLVGIDCPF